MRQQLIIGIDPGTTAGFVALDVHGNMVAARSDKHLSFENLLRQITSLGSVLLLGTDKAKVPELIKRFAAKTGAKIVSPKEDIQVIEKRNITRNFDIKDSHELDAAAAALFAYSEYLPVLTKINAECVEQNVSHLVNNVRWQVIRYDRNIVDAIRIVQQQIAAPMLQTPNPEPQTPTAPSPKLQAPGQQDIYIKKLSNALGRHKNKIKRLKEKISHLSSPQLADKKLNEKLEWKEQRIHELTKLLQGNFKQIKGLKQQLEVCHGLLVSGLVFMPRIEQLSLRELEKLEEYKGRWVWVSKGFIVSEKTAAAAKLFNVKFLVEEGKLNDALEWHPAKELRHTVFMDLIGIAKEELEKLRNPNVLQKIIGDYKRERKLF